MANEDKKDFNAMLHDKKDMPKIQIITDQKSIEKYGGSKTASGRNGYIGSRHPADNMLQDVYISGDFIRGE